MRASRSRGASKQRLVDCLAVPPHASLISFEPRKHRLAKELDEAGLPFQVLERFKNVDLHPDKVDNPTMGMIFEELIRKFNEALNENPGEHFTPRDVVHLMVDLMLAGDEPELRGKRAIRSVYDPCCGSGGMLMIATYVWVVTNRKARARKAKVQLIDATSF